MRVSSAPFGPASPGFAAVNLVGLRDSAQWEGSTGKLALWSNYGGPPLRIRRCHMALGAHMVALDRLAAPKHRADAAWPNLWSIKRRVITKAIPLLARLLRLRAQVVPVVLWTVNRAVYCVTKIALHLFRPEGAVVGMPQAHMAHGQGHLHGRLGSLTCRSRCGASGERSAALSCTSRLLSGWPCVTVARRSSADVEAQGGGRLEPWCRYETRTSEIAMGIPLRGACRQLLVGYRRGVVWNDSRQRAYDYCQAPREPVSGCLCPPFPAPFSVYLFLSFPLYLYLLILIYVFLS